MIDLLTAFNPGFILMFAGVLCALFPVHYLRKFLVIAAPALALLALIIGYNGDEIIKGVVGVGDLTLTTLRIDNLSIVWGYIFCVAGILNGIFGFHEKCRITDSSALIYTGAALGAVFAGDMVTLFVFWELTAISSVFLIWKGGRESYAAGMRYLAIHVLSGVLLLAGAVVYSRSSGTLDFTSDITLAGPGGLLLMLAMGIKVGFPLMHNWMQDAYPKSSVTGTVILSAFTTKLAVYALARAFAGEEVLIYIGAVMTIFPVFFAVMENDMRKVLAYSLNNQLGFMVCGIGIGTAMAINGVAGQVAVHIIFKSLLFMSMGAVLYRVGTAKASELGGLFKSMPITTVFCLVGAASISAFPFFAAFVTKSMIIASVLEAPHFAGQYVIFAMLLFASAGVMEHSGIKIPYFTFFSHDSGKRVKEAPWNMLLAMGLASAFCIVVAAPGGYQLLYALMPDPEQAAKFHPYTGDHIAFQMQLLFAAMLAFALLKKIGAYPAERRAQILDFDWTYRKLGKNVAVWTGQMWTRMSAHLSILRGKFFKSAANRLYNFFSPAGAMSESAPSGLAAVMTASMLVITLLMIYFGT